MEQPLIDDDHLSALRLVRWLTRDPTIDLEVVTAHDGPLLGAFSAVGDVLLLDDLNQWRVSRTLTLLGQSRAAQMAKGIKLRWWVYRRRSAELSIAIGTAARLVSTLPFAPRRLTVLSEDPDSVADLNRPTAGRGKVISHEPHAATDRVVATPQLFEGRPAPRGKRRDPIDATDDDLVVGAIGPSTWWEAPEQLVLWIWAFRRRHPDLAVRFCWLTNASETELWTLRHDLHIAGIDDVVVANHPDFLDLVPELDVVVVSGRRPSLSHLVVAARRCGVDVVATDNVDRIPQDQGVRVVPYLDVDQLADAIADFLRAPSPPLADADALPEPPLDLLRALRSW